jgi:hypothetical protein
MYKLYCSLLGPAAECILAQPGVSVHKCTFGDLIAFTNDNVSMAESKYGINPVDCVFDKGSSEPQPCRNLDLYKSLGASCLEPGYDFGTIGDGCR